MTYKEQLKHPNWLRKKTAILERDDYQCLSCLSKEKQLCIHHVEYDKGKKAWEYPDHLLKNMCIECHNSLHDKIDSGRYELNILHFFFKINPFYIDVYERRLYDFIKEKGNMTGINEATKILMAQTISKEEI